MMALTPRQHAVYDFILQFRAENGCSPSIPEIQRAFGIRSPNGVAGHLRALIRKGLIRRSSRASRRLDPVDPAASSPLHSFPIFGSIAAGLPDFPADASPEGFLRLDRSTLGFHPKPGAFALKVRGDSMNGAGILDGDLVIVEPSSSPRAGQIVAALIDGECTLKRLVRLNGKWFLKAENPAFPALHPRSGLTIQGAVRALLRRL